MASRRPPEARSPLKPDLFQVLLALSDTDRHGYGIVKEVERATAGRVRLAPSPLYRRLRKLIDAGIVRMVEDDAGEGGDPRRRYYRLTDFGREVLAAEARRLVGLAGDERIRRLAREGEASHA